VSAFHFIQPCSPVTAKSVATGDAWLHEPKLDGYRLQVAKDGSMLRLYSRRDWNKRLAALVASPARGADYRVGGNLRPLSFGNLRCPFRMTLISRGDRNRPKDFESHRGG
jgi:hypothetical protein